jgi:hypothetical protein
MDLLRLIQEGRVDDFKSKYGNKFEPSKLNELISNITPKYLDWVGKTFDVVEFEDNFPKLVYAINKFENISTNLPKTDIYQYKNLNELLTDIEIYENRSRRDVKKVEGGNVVFDDGRFFVVNPLDHKSSCYYGRGTKWCTAAETDTQFNRYNEDGKLFYIIDRSKPTSDPKYKVALLRKFEGDKIYYDAKDDSFNNGWILNTEKMNEILSKIDSYLGEEFGDQLKIYRDKESAKKEQERLNRVREERRVRGLRNSAEERRENGVWTLDDGCPDEGLKAHALLDYLVNNDGVNVLSDEDRINIERIKDEIQSLNTEYDESEDPRVDILNQIEELEDELDEYSGSYIDVYNIVPIGEYYDTTRFEVIDCPDVGGREYAVGDEDEMKSSCYESVDNLIDDIGYEGFSKDFAIEYLDRDAIVEYAEEFFDYYVRESPESYFDDSERMLSDQQEEKIEILNRRIEQNKETIERLEEQMDGENDDLIQEKIDELEELSEEYVVDIEDIEGDPNGEFSEDLIEEKVESLVRGVRSDVESYISEFGLDWSNYINKGEFIKGVIDTDGYGHTLNRYDGTAEEIYVNDTLFYVMRID